MMYNHKDPNTWPLMRPTIIAHDVGRSRDFSTAVVGGNSPVPPRLLGVKEFIQLPQGLYGSARASELAVIDRRYDSNSLIVADLSNDATYGEVLFNTFGQRVIGVHICRSGDGINYEIRPVGNGAIPVYSVGRTYLLELLHSEMQSDLLRFADSADSRRAYQQLANLEIEERETGRCYICPPGQHDDLAISLAMLTWMARHPHLAHWIQLVEPRIVRKKKEPFGWDAFT